MASTGDQRGGKTEAAVSPPFSFVQSPPAAAPYHPLFDRLLAYMVAAGQGIHVLCLLFSLSRAALEEHVIRLGLSNPHDHPPRAGGAKAWSLKDTLRLIIWRIAGVHPEVIGQRLDTPRSANAVRTKARRLGVPCPNRKDLHKPELASLRDPDAALMAALMRQGATADVALANLRDLVLSGAPKPVVSATKEPVRPAKGQPTPGQREMRFFGIVRERALEAGEPSTKPALEVPSDETKIDFEQLTWFSNLSGRRKPQTNRVAVWLGFMLVAGGLHYKEAAKKLGVTPAAFRTFRTRVGVPSDTDRRKMGAVFDLEAAKATLERSGYEMRRCLKSQNWFWARKSDRGVRYSPQFRTGERTVGDRGPRFTILTNAMLEAEKRTINVPFANWDARVPA